MSKSKFCLDQLLDATADLKLPGVCIILASFSKSFTQFAITVRDALLTVPLVVIKRLVKVVSALRRAFDIFISCGIQKQRSSFLLSFFENRQPGWRYRVLSDLEPKAGSNSTFVSDSLHTSGLMCSKVRSCIRLPVARSSRVAAC